MAISVARFDQTWLYCDPPGYFILFLATGKILAISWLFGNREFMLVNEKFCKHSGYAVGAAAEASKTISFLPNLITKPRVRNRFFNH